MRRVIIVTGASSGMGACFARQLAQESAADRERAERLRRQGKHAKAAAAERLAADELWLIARREDRLEQTRRSIADDAARHEDIAPFYPDVRAIPRDLRGREGAAAVKELLQEADRAGGVTVRTLVNNAGFGTYGRFCDTDTEREMEMIDVNCTALTGISGYALPFMQDGARIINTASQASFWPLGNFAVYGATKAYVLSFSVALAAELRERGITVTALCPGPVSTEFAAVASKGARMEVRHGLPAEQTVAHCLRAARRGRLYAIMAWRWKLQTAASRLVSRRAGAWFTYTFCRRPSN